MSAELWLTQRFVRIDSTVERRAVPADQRRFSVVERCRMDAMKKRRLAPLKQSPAAMSQRRLQRQHHASKAVP
jgi:hypothetical protein